MIKTCKTCGEDKDDSLFGSHPETKDKKAGSCRVCVNKKQRASRILNNNAHTRSYEKTKKGFIMRMYRNMKSRINGIQKKSAHLYVGKSLMDKSIFYDWCISDQEFNKLFESYQDSGYDKFKAPSVDRINTSIGYEVNNIRIISHYENSLMGLDTYHTQLKNGRKPKNSCRKGDLSNYHKVSERDVVEIRSIKKSGVSANEISSMFGISPGAVFAICSRKSWSHVV